jgi:cytochrome b6-f complex iron-sulfur subunit
MDRRGFLTVAGVGTVAAVCVSCLSGCAQSNPVSPPTGVDFTLDLSAPANAALATEGGYVYSNGVIIAKITGGSFVALSQACTHQGNTVVYRLGSNDFYCGAHGSIYSTSGAVTRGPAPNPLRAYACTLSGTSLRVQS